MNWDTTRLGYCSGGLLLLIAAAWAASQQLSVMPFTLGIGGLIVLIRGIRGTT